VTAATDSLRAAIERHAGGIRDGEKAAARAAFLELRTALTRGEIRAAERGPDGRWVVHSWVKTGILLGFRVGGLTEYGAGALTFVDKDTYPARHFAPADGVRVVPGGSSVREGAYLGPGVVCMPPMFVNAGAYVDEGSMIDSHALIGSCAQIGKRVHVSAGAQIGGVLEPVGALPVIVEDDVLIGGNCGVYEGTLVRERAVLAAGTILTGSTALVDLVHDRIVRRTGDQPLEVPAGAVVVPGSRPVTQGPGAQHGIALYTPVIVKYRDERTDVATQLEDLLR
jgi:2,3,4,5-tetrahydropyridine-2-carboxylate N-succinyltransferase